MKLRFLAVVFSLVVPLAACNTSSKSGSSPAYVASSITPPTTTTRPTLPTAAASPDATNRPSLPPAVRSPNSPSPRGGPTAPIVVASPASPSPTVATSPNPASILSKWYTYYSNEGNFTAKFPEKPEEEKSYTSSPQGTISTLEVRYIDKDNQRFYQTGYADLPIPPGAKRSSFDVEKGLDGGRNSIVSGMGATVKSEIKITQNGSPGREIILTLQDGITAKARIFINPKNLKAYQAIVATQDDKLDFPEAKAFLDSVKIAQ